VCFNKESDPWTTMRSANFLAQCAYLAGADEWLVTVAVLSTGKKVVGRTKSGFSPGTDGYFRDGRALHLDVFRAPLDLLTKPQNLMPHDDCVDIKGGRR